MEDSNWIFSERAYTSGTQFRPKPVVDFNPQRISLIVATSWGSHELANRVGQMISEQLEAPVGETTSIGNAPTHLSDMGGRLSAGIYIANAMIESEYNAREYSEAVEVLALTIENKILSWVQVGQPQLIIYQAGQVCPVAYEMDLAAQVGGDQAPLLSVALGLHKVAPVRTGSIRLLDGAQIFVASSSILPNALFALPQSFSFEAAADQLIRSSPDSPFWLGHLVPG